MVEFNFDEFPSLIHSEELKKDLKETILNGFDKPLKKGQIKRLIKENMRAAIVFLGLVLCANKEGKVIIEKNKNEADEELHKFINKNYEYLMKILKQMINFNEIDEEIKRLQKI